MTLKTKLLLIFGALAFAPLIAVGIYGHLNGLRAVESLLREDTEARAIHAVSDVEHTVSRIERRLVECARMQAVRALFAGASGGRERLTGFLLNSRRYVESVTAFDREGRPVFRVSADSDDPDGVRMQDEEFIANDLRFDARVLQQNGNEPLRVLSQESYGLALHLALPVHDEATQQTLGALFAEVRLKDVFDEADMGIKPSLYSTEASAPTGANRPFLAGDRIRHPLVAINNSTGLIVYHSNDALKHQPISTAMPYFREVAARMAAGESGSAFYDAPGNHRWLAAYKQVKGLPLSLAVAEDFTEAAAPVRRSGLLGLGLAVAAGAAALILLLIITRRATASVERVARGASAIAAGNLDQRIVVNSSDEMRGLAENFNRMSEQLRAMIAREAESKQFESFMRLSAMLTHEVKNAITGLSILVSNMERQYYREEFRADAIESLREATDKLRRLVARFNEPVVSLSGEYRRNMRPSDLVPIIRRVLAANAEPYSLLYKIETNLPERLIATFEPERIENVVENLVINAVEAMGARGGQLTVEAGEEDDGYVFFSIADTGVGMSDEFVSTRLFHPFSTTKTQGIGLGLYTVREMVEAHGGRIDVETKVGAGTRFRVVLPSRLFSSGERRESGNAENGTKSAKRKSN